MTNKPATEAWPAVIMASELVENLSEWAVLKDAGKINLIWKDDHIDGIGKVGENIVIQYGGIVNDPDYVTATHSSKLNGSPHPSNPPPTRPRRLRAGRTSNGLLLGKLFGLSGKL